jgi:hypothetical protein
MSSLKEDGALLCAGPVAMLVLLMALKPNG